MSDENAIVKTVEGDMQIPEWMLGEEFAGAGQEDIDEQISPTLHLVQAQSPEANDDLATKGEMFIRGLNVNLGKSVDVVCLMTSKEWVLWRDRSEGGGIEFKGNKAEMEAYRSGSTEWQKDEKGNKFCEAKLTRNFFFVEYDRKKDEIDPEGNGPFICSMAGRSSDAGKTLLKSIMTAGGARNKGKMPVFGLTFRITTELTENKDGEKWYIYKQALLGPVGSPETLSTLSALHQGLKGIHGETVPPTEE